jgi:hypothetical protein
MCRICGQIDDLELLLSSPEADQVSDLREFKIEKF